MFWFDPILVYRWLPEGQSGEWRIRRRIVEGDRTVWLKMGGDPEGHTSPPGTYTELYEGNQRRMSDDVFLIQRDREFVSHAHGDILLTGLGLGMVAHWLAQKPEVASIDVIEKSTDVIRLVAPYLPDKATVICADAFEYSPDHSYDFVLHDCFEELPLNESILLAKYAAAAKWQGVSTYAH